VGTRHVTRTLAVAKAAAATTNTWTSCETLFAGIAPSAEATFSLAGKASAEEAVLLNSKVLEVPDGTASTTIFLITHKAVKVAVAVNITAPRYSTIDNVNSIKGILHSRPFREKRSGI